MPKISVVDERNGNIVGEYDTVKEAEAFIAQLERIIPDDVHSGRFGIDVPEDWSKGREDYEADLIRHPLYHDGTKRPTWAGLRAIAKWSWQRPFKP